MLTRRRSLFLLLIVMPILTSCASVEPTETPPTANIPPTATATELPTPPQPTPTTTEPPIPTATPTSPPSDDNELIFSSERDGNPEIYTIKVDGSELQRLTENPERDGYPAWSPGGGRIAFYAYHGTTWSIHIMNADGTDQERLTEVPGAKHSSPAWSPDGSWIAYASDQGNSNEIWLMRPDGSEQHQIESVSGGGPAWSPDGEQIAFHSAPLEQAEITIMNPDGSDQRPLTDNEAQDWWPHWSPDGSQIAFMSDRDGNFEIYLMEVDNPANQTRLTFNDGEDWRPRWSPDGAWIAYTSKQDGNYELFIMRPDGNDQQRLTDNLVNDIQVSWRPVPGDNLPAEWTPPPATLPASAPPYAIETDKDIPYLSDGEAVHELDLYLPGTEDLPMPVLFALHGGGGNKRDMQSLAIRFAELGYAVVAPNFRESPNARYPEPVQDVFCALAWVHSNAKSYNLDPERTFALGFSLGGTFAGMLGTVDDPSLYLEECPHSLPESDWVRGVATFTGVFDLANSSGRLLDYYAGYVGASPEEDPDLWDQASPIGWLDGREFPFLLVHGELDSSIDPSHSADFAAALEEVGVPVELLIVPGTSHMTLIRSDEALEAVEQFISELMH